MRYGKNLRLATIFVALIIAGVGSMLTSACSGGGSSCETDEDCFRGKVCESGTCQAPGDDGDADLDGDAPDTDTERDGGVDDDTTTNRRDTHAGPRDAVECEGRDAGAETCDGVDNDCDGMTDENLTKSCAKQEGVCKGAEVMCTNGKFPACSSSTYKSNDSSYEEVESKKDGNDNDCDGRVDNVEYTVLLGAGTDEDATLEGTASFDAKSGTSYVIYDQGKKVFVQSLDILGEKDKRIEVTDNGMGANALRFAGSALYVGYTFDQQVNSVGYLRKYRSNGQEAWSTGFVPSDNTNYWLADVGVDRSTNFAYVLGYKYDNGPHTPRVVRYDTKGSCIDVMNKINSCDKVIDSAYPSSNKMAVGGLAVDQGNDEFYVTGTSDKEIDGEFPSDKEDAFLIRYDKSGNRKFVEMMGGTDYQKGYDVAVDQKRGVVYVVGQTRAQFAGQSYNGQSDAFIAAYDRFGNQQWVDIRGSSAVDAYNGVTVRAADGAIFVSGYTEGNFESKPSAGSYDALLVRYSGNGKMTSSRQFGTKAYDETADVWTDPETDDVYVVGNTQGHLECTSCSNGGQDVFVKRLRLP